jgi:hypothetical protein
VADKTLYLVFGNPYPGKEAEYNEWYDNVHIPDVLSVPGVVSAQRYTVKQLDRDSGKPVDYGFLTAYEVDGDPNEFMAKLGAAVASGQVRMAEGDLLFDRMSVNMSFWTPLGERVDSPDGSGVPH